MSAEHKPIDTAMLQRAAGGGDSAPSPASSVPGGGGPVVAIPFEGANMELLGGSLDNAFGVIGGSDNLMDHLNGMENTLMPLKGLNALQGLQEAKLGVGDTSLHGLGSHVNVKGPIGTIHSVGGQGH
jgi:hypothetical protein